MKLTNDMKKIMAWCYQAENVGRYEFVMDKRSNPDKGSMPPFLCRLFLTERNYFSIGIYHDRAEIIVTEWATTKTWWYPSERTTNITRYFKKYRVNKGSYKEYCARLTIEELLPILDKIDFNVSGVPTDNWNFLNRQEMW